MEVVEYKNSQDILVKFDKGNPIRTTWVHFCKGLIKNPYDRSVFGVGYIGEGDYSSKLNSTPQYKAWQSMLGRCYDKKLHERAPTYKDCFVCDEWLNFQNFAKWYDENFYEVDGERMHLDKDILVKGNKVYSPGTCVFVPMSINNLFVKSNAIRGKFPVGVIYNKKMKKYVARCKNGKGIQQTIGSYDNPSDAFYAYKHVKEKVIKSVANDLLDKIPNILYDALLRYKVEIDD
jgi:hypothetical protein